MYTYASVCCLDTFRGYSFYVFSQLHACGYDRATCREQKHKTYGLSDIQRNGSFSLL